MSNSHLLGRGGYSIDRARESDDEGLLVGEDYELDAVDRHDEEILNALGAPDKLGMTAPKKSGWKKSKSKKQPPKRVHYDDGYTSRDEADPFDVRRHNDDDDDDDNDDRSTSDSEDDLIIDLERPMRHRRKRPKIARGYWVLLALILLMGGYIIGTLTGSSPIRSSSPPYNKHKTEPKTILNNGTHDFHPSTVVISLDGFHPHYVSEALTPYLHQLMTLGGGAPYIVPSFPSSTFPNHWTLVTGLYPNNHGIVGNQFYDPKLGKRFYNTRPAQSLDPVWWGGEPIWKTLQKRDVTTAVHMWPGSEVNWGVYDPMIVDGFNASETLENKSQRLVSWLDEGDLNNRPELMLAYVPTIDVLGHLYGPSGVELEEGLKEVDAFVGRLLTAISDRNLTDIANIVILSDHGMAPTSNDRLIYLDDMIDLDTLEHIDGWPLFGLRPNDTSSEGIQRVYDTLKAHETATNDTNWSVYKKEDLPKEWHFGGTEDGPYASRVAPVWLIPSVGWSVTTHETMDKLKGDYLPRGVHGYNNTEFLMRALFLAQGPFFGDQESRFAPFENVNVYALICHSLGVTPAPNDGKDRIAIKGLADGWTDKFVDDHGDLRQGQTSVNSTFDALYGAAKSGQNSAAGEDMGSHNALSSIKNKINQVESSIKSGLDSTADWLGDKTGWW